MFLDVRNACDRWLQKRGLGPTAPYGRALVKPASVVGRLAEPPKERPLSKTKLKRMKKYATPEERKAAMQVKTKAYWAALSPEQKAKRLAQLNGGQNV